MGLLIPSATLAQIDLTPVRVSVTTGDTLFTWKQDQAKYMRKMLEERNQYKHKVKSLEDIAKEYKLQVGEQTTVIDRLEEQKKKTVALYINEKQSNTRCNAELGSVTEERDKYFNKLKRTRTREWIAYGVAALTTGLLVLTNL